MPIDLDSDGEPETPPVEPGTNAHALLAVLAAHPDLGFAPRELTELTDVPHASVHKTLSRLDERGLVRSIDSCWAIAGDIAATRIANRISLAAIEDDYGDDAYGSDDSWVDDRPDLGETT